MTVEGDNSEGHAVSVQALRAKRAARGAVRHAVRARGDGGVGDGGAAAAGARVGCITVDTPAVPRGRVGIITVLGQGARASA